MVRLVAASPEFQAHNWIIERNGPWTHKVVEQLTMFPAAKHDDIADAVSQAAIWLQANSYELSFVQALKERGERWLQGNFIRSVQCKRPAKEEAQGEGSVITKDQWTEWNRAHRAPPCPYPKCGSTATVILPGGIIHCNQCGRDNGKELGDREIDGHVHRWRSIPGGMERCDDCEQQRYVPGQPPMIAGVSRKDYWARIGRNRGR